MQHFLTPRQPSILILCLLGLGAFAPLSWSSSTIERASAEPQTQFGEQVKTLKQLSQMPDGQHQLCSEPEPTGFLQGAGICFWFKKVGPQFIGYYGLPHSGEFIDCVSGTINEEKLVGEAIAVSWGNTPFPSPEQLEKVTWKTLTLGSGTVEYQSSNRFGDISLIRFDKAELTLRDFYRYSPERAKKMNLPPDNCNVQEWVKRITI